MPSLDHDSTTRDIPSYYQPNALLCGIRLDGCDLPLTVQVIFPFTPFCMSQVLLVKPIGDPNALKLPPKFILKVYDPRFYPYRLRTANKPWSYAAETEAAEKRPARRNPEFDECNTPKTDDAVSWEEFFYQFSEEQFYYESSAYIRLAPLQGKVIPRPESFDSKDARFRLMSSYWSTFLMHSVWMPSTQTPSPSLLLSLSSTLLRRSMPLGLVIETTIPAIFCFPTEKG